MDTMLSERMEGNSGKRKLRNNLIYEERDQSDSLALENHSRNYDNVVL